MSDAVLQPYVVEFRKVSSQTVVAADIKTAAAIAAAIACAHGALVHAVYSKDEYDQILQEREKGKTLGTK